MIAGDIVSWVSNSLGFTLSRKITNPMGALLSRLPACVLRIVDEAHAGYVTKAITTIASVGEYMIGTGYDSVRSREWPGEWYNIVPSLTGSHSVGSDITAENLFSKDGPVFVEPVTLKDLQVRVTQYGAESTYPVAWSYWLNEEREFVFAVAPKESVTAGLTITLELFLSRTVAFAWEDTLPVEDHYEQLLRNMLAAAGASYAQGELVAQSDYQGAQYYQSREQFYLGEVEREYSRLVRAHNPTTQKAEINTLGSHWFPPTTD